VKKVFSSVFLFFTTLIILGISFFPKLIEIAELNNHAIKSSQSLMKESKNYSFVSITNDPKDEVTCHEQWLSWVNEFYSMNYAPNFSELENLISCSVDTIYLLSKYYPTNQDLAVTAINYYPENTFPLMWLYNSLIPGDPEELQIILEKVILVYPKNGFAWSRLGYIYENQNQLDLALNAFKNACKFGDVGVHGCYGAGRLFEKLDDYPNAIDYYFKSRWEYSIEQGIRLEEESNLGTINN